MKEEVDAKYHGGWQERPVDIWDQHGQGGL